MIRKMTCPCKAGTTVIAAGEGEKKIHREETASHLKRLKGSGRSWVVAHPLPEHSLFLLVFGQWRSSKGNNCVVTYVHPDIDW